MIIFGSQFLAWLLCFIGINFSCSSSIVGAFDIPFLSSDKSKKEFSLSEEGYWKTRLESLEEAYRKFRDEFQKKKRDLAGRRERVSGTLSMLEDENQSYKPLFREKKAGLLRDRLLKFEALEEVLGMIEELYQKNIALVSEMLAESKKEASEQTPVLYSTLQDEHAKKDELSKAQQQERNEKRNSERLEKQKRLEVERKGAVEEEIAECKTALKGEDMALASTLLGDLDGKLSKAEREDLLNVKFALLNDQREVIDLTIRKIDLQLQRSEYLQLRNAKELNEARKQLQLTERQLRITPIDIEAAKQEADQEQLRSTKTQQQLSDWIATRKKERENLRARRDALESQRRLYREFTNKDPVKDFVLEAKLNALDEQIRTLDQEIELMSDQKAVEEEKASLKARYVRYVDLRHKGNEGALYSEDVESLINDVKREAKKYGDELQVLEEQRSELSHLGVEIQQKKERTEKLGNDLLAQQETLFRGRPREYQEAENALDALRKAITTQISINPKHISTNIDLTQIKKELMQQEELMVKLLEQQQRFDIWERSPNAIQWESFKRSLKDGELFLRSFFWRLPHVLSLTEIARDVARFAMLDYVSLLGFLLLFFILYVFVRRLLIVLLSFLDRYTSDYQQTIVKQTAQIFSLIIEVLLRYYTLAYIWFFCILGTVLGDSILYPFEVFKIHFDLEWRRSLVVSIYLLGIPFLLFLVNRFVRAFRMLNRREDYAFFSPRYEMPFLVLMQVILYVSAILLPLRWAFTVHVPIFSESIFPSVIMAAYTLMLQFVAVAFVFFHKEELLGLLPSEEGVWGWIRRAADRYYYPVFLFFLVLLTLSNPYVGYTNLAYKLLLAAPLTLLILYSVFAAHFYLRRYSAYWFIYEEEGEVVGRFDHAKTYYGMFIGLTFLLFLFIAAMVIGWIWGLEATFERVHYLLSQQWTLPIGPDKRIGVIQLVVFILFIALGFLISTLLDKFVLDKIFDVLQMDPGVRNTASSIFHYVVIYFIVVLGLNYIQLGDLVFYVTSILAIGIGFGMQPFLHDFLAGLLILLERPVEIGNFIETGGTRGTVQKISPRSITIRTFLNHLVVVPNKELITKPIINWGYGRSTVGFDLRVQASYDSAPEEVMRVLEGVIQSDSRVLRIPAPVIRLDEFAENGMVFLLRAHISARRVRQQWDIAGELRTKIYWAFKANNIKIPYPHRVIHYSTDPNVHLTKGQGPVSIKFDNTGDPEQ